jgi:glycosyltransferase involved in cell wall biosynthesis
MGAPEASIIVRCYNEAEHIGKLLHGLAEQQSVDYEVIVVDSGSTDGTLEILDSYDVETIAHIAPEQFSFGRALNRGFEAARGEFCVIASAHVYPRRNDWLEALLRKFDDEGQTALVYGKQRGNNITTFSENQIFKRWFPDRDIEQQDHPFCNNANAAVRRELWEKFPYDEQLTGLEDVDWAQRVQNAGYEIAYASDAEIVHIHDESAREVYNRYRREAYAHKQIMSERSFSLLDFVRLSGKNVISDCRAALRQGGLLGRVSEILKFRLLQFLGTYRGFNREGPISERLYQRFYYPDTQNYSQGDVSVEGGTRAESAGEVTEIDYTDENDHVGPVSDD